MTKRNPAIYNNYAQKRPQYPFRLSEQQKDEVEEMRQKLGLTKQAFMEQVFNLGFPLLTVDKCGNTQ